MIEISGYTHRDYALSLSDFGTPRALPRSGGWILERQIPGFPYRDAMGGYPLFSCPDWSGLQEDLNELRSELVCVSLVADPFGLYEPAHLQRCFGELFVPFKAHCVMDLQKGTAPISRHHRRYARKALAELSIEKHTQPVQFLDEFVELHETLVRKHGIRGIRAFSREAFRQQLSIPGAVMLRARKEDVTVAAILYFVQPTENVVFGHTLGYTDLGYRLGAQYALYWTAIDYFADRVRWCDVGGVPGCNDAGSTGLNWFKRGWSQETRTAYLCGRIFDFKKYQEVLEARGLPAMNYFPAYRAGEME